MMLATRMFRAAFRWPLWMFLIWLVPHQTGRPLMAQEAEPYRSPYSVEFSVPVEELIGDLIRTERGDPRLEATIPSEHWYSRETRERDGSWGPHPREYPAVRGLEAWPVERLRERVIAAALRFQGYEYQHHHIPDWNPPADWPWSRVAAGHNGRGVDCSNFTGFVYNQGFGVHLNTDVSKQAEESIARGPGAGRGTRLERIELPADYQARVDTLRTGDLLFIRSDKGHISHVVLWVGPIGRSPDGLPLILDSHGSDVVDSNGVHIPAGVHLRPFRERSWYDHSADHALRVFGGK